MTILRIGISLNVALVILAKCASAQHASVGTQPITSSVLRALGEPILDPNVERRPTFRALWLRSFHNPVAVRIVAHRGSYSVITSEVAMQGDSITRVVRRDSSSLPAQTWNLLQQRLAIQQFYTRSYWRFTKPNTVGVDGANWILEGVKGKEYQYIDWWSPEERGEREGLFRRVFLEILSMGTVCVSPDAVY